MFKYGYFLHDHVAPLAQIHVKGNPRIHPTASMRCGRNIYVGWNSHINHNCCVWASKNSRILIGDDVLMGPGVKIFSSNHATSDIDVPFNRQSNVESDVVIEDNVWLGANCVVVAGVTVGHDSVVAAGSVVTKDIPPYAIAGGVPAKHIKSRK